MADYGSAITWIVIIFTLFVVGILYMMLTPLFDTLLLMGEAQVSSGGCDPVVLDFLDAMIHTYVPVATIFGIIVYGWRKSAQRIQ